MSNIDTFYEDRFMVGKVSTKISTMIASKFREGADIGKLEFGNLLRSSI